MDQPSPFHPSPFLTVPTNSHHPPPTQVTILFIATTSRSTRSYPSFAIFSLIRLLVMITSEENLHGLLIVERNLGISFYWCTGELAISHSQAKVMKTALIGHCDARLLGRIMDSRASQMCPAFTAIVCSQLSWFHVFACKDFSLWWLGLPCSQNFTGPPCSLNCPQSQLCNLAVDEHVFVITEALLGGW